MEYLERRVALVEDRLEAVIDEVEPDELSEEVGHVVLAGGKRVRPRRDDPRLRGVRRRPRRSRRLRGRDRVRSQRVARDRRHYRPI